MDAPNKSSTVASTKAHDDAADAAADNVHEAADDSNDADYWIGHAVWMQAVVGSWVACDVICEERALQGKS